MATLNESDGHQVRLIDDVRTGPSISKAADGSYVFNFRYEPENRNAFVGHDIRELQNVTAVGTRYAGLLDALGIPANTARVTHLSLWVNGQGLVSNDVDTAVSGVGEQFDTTDVSGSFRGIGGG